MSMENTIPLTVPKSKYQKYLRNYSHATQDSGRLFLFSGDQKIEHLNKDFYGPSIPIENASPKHLFDIASNARIGAFATQLGLIARYGMNYSKINYVIKVNSKTNLSKDEPNSSFLYSPRKSIEFAESNGLNIIGLGYTVYLGSKYESLMLEQACDVISSAHENGLLAILWMYPRGKAVENEFDENIIAGAAGVGAALGADFVKVNPSIKIELLNQAVLAAGKTKVMCSGGEKINETLFLQKLSEQIKVGIMGAAIGRNIHQKTLTDAIKFCDKIARIVIDGE